MTTTELIIFDWDGTLIDSSDLIVESVQRAIAATGLPPHSDDAIRQIIGLGMAEAVATLYPDQPEHARAELAHQYRASFARTATRAAPLFAGVEALLQQLERSGYLLAVATGKSRTGLLRDWRASGVGERFAASRTVDECASKPSPAMVQELLAAVGVDACRALMVGDTVFDLQMAAAAGVAGVGVTWGVHGRQQLREAGAARLLESFDELHPCLEQPDCVTRPNV